MRNDKDVNSPQANKERTFHVYLLAERMCILRKYQFYNCPSASGLFLTRSLFSTKFQAHVFINCSDKKECNPREKKL